MPASSDNLIPPAVLAHNLNIPIQVIRALAAQGYLRVVRPFGSFGSWSGSRIGKIARDPDGIVHWPVVKLATVRNRIDNYSVDKLVEVCRKEKIAVRNDEFLGMVVSANGLHRLLVALQLMKHRYPIDRVGMLLWLTGLESPDPHKMPAFDQRAEVELIRIAKLQEPMRTEQAVRFLLRWRDAETIAKAVINARVDDVLNADRRAKAQKLRYRLGKMTGVEEMEGEPSPRQDHTRTRTQTQAQSGRTQRQSPASSPPARAASRPESSRKPHPMTGR